MREKLGEQAGITMIEALVSVAIFVMVGVVIYEFFGGMFVAVQNSRTMLSSVELLQEQVEIVRNLPYEDVGISGGIPDGILDHTRTVNRDGQQYEITTTIRNVDDPADGTIGGSPEDLSPEDYKLVEISVSCTSCKNSDPMHFTTTQAPKDLEGLSTNGALFIRALDGSGMPVQDASVTVLNEDEDPDILIEDVTDNEGYLKIIGVPPGSGTYQVTVTKAGYSTDQTYPEGETGNPNPVKEHATVIAQDITPLSMFIDELSTLNVSSINQTCTAIGNVPFQLSLNKKIGKDPDVLKYQENLATGADGNLTLNDMEWGSYSAVLTGDTYDLMGLVPLDPLDLTPGSVADLQMIVTPDNPLGLMVTVKDNSTKLPISGAQVTLTKSSWSETKHTGRGYLGQTDWSGGAGQNDFTDPTRFFDSNGNIEISDPVGDMRLLDVGSYASSGTLTSSSFDTGTTSNFHQLLWEPTVQPPETGEDSVRFQIATNTDNLTWDFVGPDGTAGSYYTDETHTIHSSHDGDRYLRYKAFLSTDDLSYTPNVSDVNFTFSSGCLPPGQVLFGGLGSGTYELTVSASGYQDYEDSDVSVSENWAEYELLMNTSS